MNSTLAMDSTLRLGTDVQFAAIREFLRSCDFTLDTVANRLHEDLPFDFTKLRPGPADTEPCDALELLIRTFILGETVSWTTLSRLVPPTVVTAFAELQLLNSYTDPDHAYSPFALYPVHEIFIVSDRWSTPDCQPFKLRPDAVYPALTHNAQVFLSGLFQTPCDDLLDICSGTGVAALLGASRFAKTAVATDILERCIDFCDFNRRLNGLENVIVLASDVYDAVDHRTFDRIFAHPPYVPVLRPRWVYHDGGTDGEAITRRIIEGLPRYLRPGGIFQCHTMASDRDLPFEKRIRTWLGDVESEFDVCLVIWNRMDPSRFAIATAVKDGSLDELDRWKQLFEEWQVARLLDVSVTLSRHAHPCLPLDVRRFGGDHSSAPQVEWLLHYERISRDPRIHEQLLLSHPTVAEGIRFDVSHIIEDGELRAASCRAILDYPFKVNIDIDRWMPLLLASCNGQRSGFDLFEQMKQQQHIDLQTAPAEFAALLARMVSQGFIRVENFPLPPSPHPPESKHATP